MKYEFTGAPGPYTATLKYDTYEDRPIVMCGIHTANASALDGPEYTLACGYGNLDECFTPIEKVIANFHLFAASPALLSALIKAVEYIDSENEGYNEYHIPDWYREAKAAI